MAKRLWVVVAALAMSVVACSGTSQVNRKTIAPDDPVIGLLDKGITQLNLNIETLSKRMNDVQQASAGTDPVLRELQALDLSGWQLHRQQWILQRDHLMLARDLLERSKKIQGEKGPLLDEWSKQRLEYIKAMEDLRHQRQYLENKHLEVEARLVERGLR